MKWATETAFEVRLVERLWLRGVLKQLFTQ